MMKFLNTKTLVYKNFMLLLLPAIFSTVVEYLLTLTDNIIASQLYGEKALTAITLCQPYFSAVVFVNMLILSGASVLSSNAVGEDDRDLANKYFTMGMFMSVVVGILLTVASFLFKEQLLDAFEVSTDVYNYANDYFSYLMFYPLLMFYNVLFTIIMNEGGSKWCTQSVVVIVVSNIVLSLVLGYYIGVAGISMATIISMALATIPLCFQFFEKNNPLYFSWYFDWKKMKTFLVYGISESMIYLYISILYLFFNWFLLKYYGEDAIVIFTIVMSLQVLLIMVYDGCSQVLQPMIIIYQGENNLPGIRKTLDVSMWITVILACVVTLFMLVIADYIPMMFGITDAELTRSIAWAVRIVSLGSVFYCIGLLFNGYLLYIRRFFMSWFVLLLLVLFFTIPLAAALGIAIDLNGVWIGIGVSSFFAVLTSLLLLYIMCRKQGLNFPYMLDKDEWKRQYAFDIKGTMENIPLMLNNIEQELIARNVSTDKILKILLMAEESTLLALDKNKTADFYLEYTLMFQEKIRLIVRSNGVHSNVTDADATPDSMQEYLSTMIVSSQQLSKSNFSLSVGNNRNIFDF